MANNYYKKTKKSFKKKHTKGTKIFLKKKKTKSTNMLVSNIEISLKKKKKRSMNVVVNYIRILQRMSIEKHFLELNKSRLSEYKTLFIISDLGCSMELFRKV